MADLLLACARHGRGAAPAGAAPLTADRVRRAALLLAPPGIEPHAPELAGDGGGPAAQGGHPQAEGHAPVGAIIAAIANPQPGATRLRPGGAGGACIGVSCDAAGDWWRVGADPPDAAGALARWDERTVELLADACASRSLWYAQTEGAFLASTSQRALVALLDSFELEPEAVSWMLSAGMLGPEVSWDARLRCLPPDARLSLDRETWRLDLRAAPRHYEPADGGRDEHVARMREALLATCARLDLALDRWPLALSGGVDSRALLAAFVRLGLRPRCLTWTTRHALRDPLSDVSVARLVAKRVGVEHEIVVLDPPPGGVEEAVDCFVTLAEGLTDEFAGYVDGSAMWRDLFRAGVLGVLRSDEAYGTYAFNPATHENTRLGVCGPMVDDYPREHLVRGLGLARQSFPERLRARPGEDRLSYRVRMIHESWNATRGAALSGIKSRFVEVAEPHLSRRVLEVVRTLPASLLRGKAAVVAISRDVAPHIPTARSSSTPSMAAVLRSPAMTDLLVRTLTDPKVERVLPGDGALRLLVALVAAETPGSPPAVRAKDVLRSASVLFPKPVVARLKPPWKGPDALPASRLAFRVLLASRAVARLEDDARSLREGWQPAEQKWTSRLR